MAEREGFEPKSARLASAFFSLLALLKTNARSGKNRGFDIPRLSSSSSSCAGRRMRRNWRRGRDSNPRYGCPYAAFRVRCIRPLCHLSELRRLERRGAVFSGVAGDAQGRAPAALSKLPAELAVERIRPAAA